MSNTIYRYTPNNTEGPFGNDPRPFAVDNNLTELCEIDNYRYVSVPENVEVTIPEEITTWEIVDITPELRETLKINSPHCQLIAQKIIDKIKAKYTLDDELYFARISVGALQGTYQLQDGELAELQQYQIDVEAAREWGRSERTMLGL